MSFIFIRFCSFCALFEIKLSLFSAKNDSQFEWLTIAYSIWNVFTIQSQNNCFISSNVSIEYPISNLIRVHSQCTKYIYLYFNIMDSFANVFCLSVEQCFPCLFGLKHSINLLRKIFKICPFIKSQSTHLWEKINKKAIHLIITFYNNWIT